VGRFGAVAAVPGDRGMRELSPRGNGGADGIEAPWRCASWLHPPSLSDFKGLQDEAFGAWTASEAADRPWIDLRLG
jgi:hypothetical protein